MLSKAPAKINLFLHVVGKREDGYHLLESLFTPLKLADEISIIASDKITSLVNGVEIVDNIVIKAAMLLKSEFTVDSGCHIDIKKSIPVGGGLGGGSSNAATVLKMLTEFWKLDVTKERLKELALKLGADVPFFMECKTAFVQGIGEHVTPMNLDIELPILLINPNINISTENIFQKGIKKITAKLDPNEDMKTLIYNGSNDLYENACEYAPELRSVIEFLQEQDGIQMARMSGTGSTCFGIFQTIQYVIKAQRKIEKGWWSYSELLKV
jgi:4-diphosphocytidyl-2-C-methyl-D-erythritol kinase